MGGNVSGQIVVLERRRMRGPVSSGGKGIRESARGLPALVALRSGGVPDTGQNHGMTQTIQARTVADELRVIRKALRRLQAHQPHETLPVFERVRWMIEEAKARRL